MVSGYGNENRQEKISRFNQQKHNFARAAHFFCTFLCRCFARLQRSLFFAATHFHLGDR